MSYFGDAMTAMLCFFDMRYGSVLVGLARLD